MTNQTTTTDSQGEFSTQITGLSEGTYEITIEYAGDDNYTSSTVTRTVNVFEHLYDIDITSTTPVIQEGDSANIVATLTDNDIAVAGETLSYQVKHGSTVLDSGTGTTNANGQITITYLGTGIGDVDIVVSGMSLQETYEVEDCYFYDDYDGSKTSHYTAIRSSPTFSNSIATFPRTSNNQSYYILNEPLDFDYELEIGFVKYSGNYIYRLAYFDGTTKKSDGVTYSNSEGNFWGMFGTFAQSVKTGDIIKYKFTRDKLEFYYNDVLKATNTNATTIGAVYGKLIGFNHDNNIGMQIDYIKIKPL